MILRDYWLLIRPKFVKSGRKFRVSVHRSMKSLSNYPEPLFRLEGGIRSMDRFSGLFPIILLP